MKAALRDAKTAEAKVLRPKRERTPVKSLWPQAQGIPWPGREIAHARRRAGLWRSR